MADDADGSSEPLSGVALLNAALDGLLDILVGLQCLSNDADYIWRYGEHWDVLFDLEGDYYGLGWRPNNVSDATRRPRGVWVSDWQNEVIGWLRSEGVDTRGLSSDELVAEASKKLGGWEYLLRPDTVADHVAKAASVGEVLKYVPKHVKGLWDGQAKADKAIQAFPAVVLTALDGLRGGSWRTRLRSELLNVACRWPGTKGQGMSACYVPAGAKAFISLVGERDPRETWKKYIDLVEDARADILAAGGEVQTTTPAESVKQTAPLPASVSTSADSAESLAEALRKLDRFDELMRGAQAHNKLKSRFDGKAAPDELTRAAAVWTGKESIPEFCELAASLAEEAEFYRCKEGGHCFALVAKNWWQCLDDGAHMTAAINAHTLGQTIIELRAKLRAEIRRMGTPKGPSVSGAWGGNAYKLVTDAAIKLMGNSPLASSQPPAPVKAADDTSLLLSSLRRLRERFAAGQDKYRKLPMVLIHRDMPSQRVQPETVDAVLPFGWKFLSSFHGPSCEQRQLRSRDDYEAVARRPFLDNEGKPWTNGAGDPIPLAPQWHRIVSLYRLGDEQPLDADSVERFSLVAEEAGAIVVDLPDNVAQVIWQKWDRPLVLPSKHRAGVWLTAVFELAWQKHKRSGLIADRRAWEGRTSATVEMLEDALAGRYSEPWLVEFAESIGVPSACWFSEIENAWQASVAAIDLIVQLLTAKAEDIPKTPTVPQEKLSVQSEQKTEAESELSEIEELEKATPPLVTDNGLWVSNKRAAAIEGLKSGTLSDYRRAGKKTTDEMFGRDKDGRIWRRVGTPNRHPWYLRSTLTSDEKH